MNISWKHCPLANECLQEGISENNDEKRMFLANECFAGRCSRSGWAPPTTGRSSSTASTWRTRRARMPCFSWWLSNQFKCLDSRSFSFFVPFKEQNFSQRNPIIEKLTFLCRSSSPGPRTRTWTTWETWESTGTNSFFYKYGRLQEKMRENRNRQIGRPKCMFFCFPPNYVAICVSQTFAFILYERHFLSLNVKNLITYNTRHQMLSV